MIIGVTGSIGSGKTTAAKIFSKCHYDRIDADKISHELMKNSRILKNNLIKNFGEEILDEDNEIDRKILGSIGFSDN